MDSEDTDFDDVFVTVESLGLNSDDVSTDSEVFRDK